MQQGDVTGSKKPNLKSEWLTAVTRFEGLEELATLSESSTN
jgi:hypothetical protein